MVSRAKNQESENPLKKRKGAKIIETQEKEVSTKTHKKIAPEDKEVMELIGKKIRELRKSQNMKYVDMAKAVGMSKNNYSLIELGQIYFKMSSLLLILKYHKIHIIDFFKSLERKED